MNALAKLGTGTLVAAPATALVQTPRPAPSEPQGERVDLPEAASRQAEERYAVIAPLVDFQKLRQSHRTVRAQDGRVIKKSRDLAKYLSTCTFSFHTPEGDTIQKRVSACTIWRWFSRYREAERKRQNGKLGLARPVRCDKDTARIFARNPKAAAYVKAKYLHEKLTNLSLIYESLCHDWPRLGVGDPPCFNTMRHYLAALPRPLVTLAHEGPRAWLAKHAPFVQRVPPPVMDTWVSDHRQHDVFVRNTMFAHLEPQQMYRLWITAIYDWGSRKLLGFSFSPTPSSRTLGSAFSMAAYSAGAIAPNFYWDNGEDYKRFERILLAPELQAIFESRVTRALPYNPRSKPVESWFNAWSQKFDLLWRPAWCGRKPGQCPEDCRKAQKMHQQFRAGKRADSPLPSDADFILAARKWIEEYNAAPHSKLGGCSPNEVFDAGHPLERRGQLDRRLLDVLFWQREERMVLQGGCVELLNARYEPTDETLLSMDALQGRRVVVKYDPFNLGRALALDQEGRFVGELRAQKFLTQSAHGRVSADDIHAAKRRESKVRRNYCDTLESVALESRARGWKSEAAQLLERARERFALPATGTESAVASAAPGAGTSFQQIESLPRTSLFVEVSDEDVALMKQFEVDNEI
jgi:hypothetical protein